MELARKLREIEKAKIAHAAAELALHAAKKAIKERNHEIKLAKIAHEDKMKAESHARDEFKKWQVAVEYTRKMLDKRVVTEKATHEIMAHQQRLTTEAKMMFVRAQVARIAAVKKAVSATKIWKEHQKAAKDQQAEQVTAEKLAAYWKAKRDEARKHRDIAISEKKQAHKEMDRDHALYIVSKVAKHAAEDKLAEAEKLVVHWKLQVTTWTTKYEHQMKLRSAAKKDAKHMTIEMKLARVAADKMEGLMKTAKEHYHAATHTLKITLKVLHKGTHAYKESVLKWKSITDLTKKDHAEKEMELKKEWMSKVEIRHTKAAETLE